MKSILMFIFENYQFFLTIFGIIVSLCVLIFRKKVKVESDVVLDIISQLPSIISKVENMITSEKSGAIKKAKVLDIALLLYKNITGVSVSYDSKIAERFDSAIEDILATPQKKGR